MNQTQIKYARERAAAIHKRRSADLQAEHTIAPVTMTVDEKLKAIKSGAFSIVPPKDRQSGYNSGWSTHVIFRDEVKGGLSPSFGKAKAKLDAAFTKLNDELVLGDNEMALKLLEAFDV